MIIGIDVNGANKSERTGVEWYSFYLINELKKIIPDNIEVRLYSQNVLKKDLQDLPENWTLKILKWPFKKFWTQLRLSWEMLINPPDILFVPSYVPPLIHPYCTIVTVHDLAFLEVKNSYSWWQNLQHRLLIAWILKTARKIIVPSVFVKNSFRLLGFKKNKKIKVIAHGFNKSEPDKHYSQKFKNIEYILFIGRLEDKKNVVNIIKAFNLLKEKFSPQLDKLELFLVGKPGFGYEKIKTEIKNSKYSSSIKELGWLCEAKKWSLLSQTKLIILPSLSEGFGLPILEAWASGKPIIVSKNSALDEVGKDACLKINPYSVTEIENALEDILLFKRKKFVKDIINKGFNYLNNFTWQISAKKTWNLIKSCKYKK